MYDVELPKWGMTMQDGTISRWLKKPGDRVVEGEPIAIVETEKVDTDLEAPRSGVLKAVLVQEGQTVEVGTVIARIDDGS
ncbi:biotin/lipoyl attachment [Rubrobacter xylanophilus DSM 9941]|uniref:Biotin/lipoyl attachment n=1 Tax=Rubrobacter xylanophilus (strain DSM 9941 / JCM 11954 / NBRC 16129 / PRD-1) TaxID=266117 RepID=Q1ARM2_RUBXD|nr:biotin/lipoyl-containing protein [Rubrobacter xylanophilus]ABG05956.1 biotin/lipoyl attachment [Rubrobacter xylanophilus DSM 9941]